METAKSNIRNSFKGLDMKRFNYSDDDQDENLFYDTDDEDDDDEEVIVDPDEYDDVMDKAFAEAQIELAERDLNRKLLMKTIKMLQGSWLWRFRSEAWKQKRIAETYQFLQSLVNQEEKNEED